MHFLILKFIIIIHFPFVLGDIDYGSTYIMKLKRPTLGDVIPIGNFGSDIEVCYYGESYHPQNLPCGRYGSMIFRSGSSSNEFYIFGGRRSYQMKYYNDLWMYDTENSLFRCIKGTPCGIVTGEANPSYDESADFQSGEFHDDNMPHAISDSILLADLTETAIFGFGVTKVETTGYDEGSLLTVSTIFEFNKTSNQYRLIPTQSFYTQEWYNEEDYLLENQGMYLDVSFVSSRMYAHTFASKRFPELTYLYGGYCISPSCNDGVREVAYDDFYVFNSNTYKFLVIEDTEQNYGTRGVESVSNYPGHRYGGATFTNGGYAFLFGGSCDHDDLNDLWRFNMTDENFNHTLGSQPNRNFGNGMWTWMTGSNHGGSSRSRVEDNYHFSSGNYPGSLHMFLSWTTDKYGVMIGQKEHQYSLSLNELWLYEFSTGLWLYMYSLKDLNRVYSPSPVPNDIMSPRSGLALLQDGNSETVHLYGGFNHFRVHTEDCALEINEYPFPEVYELSIGVSECWEMMGNESGVCYSRGRCLQPDLCYCNPGYTTLYCDTQYKPKYDKYRSEYDLDLCKGVDNSYLVEIFVLSFTLPLTIVMIYLVLFSTIVVIGTARGKLYIRKVIDTTKIKMKRKPKRQELDSDDV